MNRISRYAYPRVTETQGIYTVTCGCGWTRQLCSGGTGYTAITRMRDNHAASHEEPDHTDPFAPAS
jgi:hypothetical protein